MTADRFVYGFGSAVKSPELLGGKGASLARMSALGLPIPPGFTIATTGWSAYRDARSGIPPEVADEVAENVAQLERQLDRAFDDPERPLLVSVRSGAPVSMPGMMDTVLNLGLSDPVVDGLGRLTDERFAAEVYVRLLETYAGVVRGVPDDVVDDARERFAALPGARDRGEAWKELIAEGGSPFPQDARAQLDEAIEAVWRSWEGRRARRYRKFRGISEDLGTAVTVQAMVFGNLDERSGTGVVFTRDPATGRPGAYGDFLPGAQGEDVVAGVRTPKPIEVAVEHVPEAFAELDDVLTVLETAYCDMCDIEFTVESGQLWILQARVGQRSGAAAVRIAVDMVDEGLIDIETAIERVPLSALEELQAPVAARDEDLHELGRGVPASPGTAVGEAVFDSRRAEDRAEAGHDVVLVRPETSPRDIAGMIASRGIVTAVGGRASHAAVVARGIGRAAVCGVEGLEIDADARCAVMPSGDRLREGDAITVDGSGGVVLLGAADLVPPQPGHRVARFLDWCDERARVPVVQAPPDAFERATSREGCDKLGERVLVDVPWEGSESRALLEAVCAALHEDGTRRRLALALPESLRGGDLVPPAARWEAIVSSPRSAWAARLLSAKIPVVGVAAAGVAERAAPRPERV
jgi:pyruvate,orthophosphate dikinase